MSVADPDRILIEIIHTGVCIDLHLPVDDNMQIHVYNCTLPPQSTSPTGCVSHHPQIRNRIFPFFTS
jgi:hypothetical protein